MTRLAFHIVDVFAEKKYAGNQLAVFQRAGALSSDEMQQIAREINFSETTFILSDEQRNGGFDVRIFTPREGAAPSQSRNRSPQVIRFASATMPDAGLL